MNDKHKITEQDVNNYLEGNTQISKDYAASKNIKAPEYLDTLVKKMVSDASSVDDAKPGNSKWVLPAAIAASVALVIGVVLNTEVKDDEDKTKIAFNEKPLIKESDSKDVNKNSVKAIAKNKIKQPRLEQQSASRAPEAVAENTKDFKMPEGFDELLQNTSAGSSNKLPPDPVLKKWTREQWKQQVKELKAAQKSSLAKKYIDKFLEFYPEDKLFTEK